MPTTNRDPDISKSPRCRSTVSLPCREVPGYDRCAGPGSPISAYGKKSSEWSFHGERETASRDCYRGGTLAFQSVGAIRSLPLGPGGGAGAVKVIGTIRSRLSVGGVP